MVSVHFGVVLPCDSLLSLLLKSKMKPPPSMANMTCQFSGRIWIINTWHNLFSFKLSDSEYPLGPCLNIRKLPFMSFKILTGMGILSMPAICQTASVPESFKLQEWWRLSLRWVPREWFHQSVQTRILSPSTQKFMVILPRNDLGQPINSPSSAIHFLENQASAMIFNT